MGGRYRGGGGGNTSNRGGAQTGPRRDPNAMDVDRGRGGDRTCYVYEKWDHIAKNYWESITNGHLLICDCLI